MHLVPIIKECTWENKGTKHIKVLKIEDKKQMTLIISSSINGLLSPLQLVFINTTQIKSLPFNNQRKNNCIKSEWDFTFTKNHWSTFEITKGFIHKFFCQ